MPSLQSGASLIEVLVSLILLSMMLLSFDAIQLFAVQKAKSALYFSTANHQLDEMHERLKVLNGEEVTEQFVIWNEHNQDVLPQGRGYISEQASKIILSLFWGGGNEEQCDQNKIGVSGCVVKIINRN